MRNKYWLKYWLTGAAAIAVLAAGFQNCGRHMPTEAVQQQIKLANPGIALNVQAVSEVQFSGSPQSDGGQQFAYTVAPATGEIHDAKTGEVVGTLPPDKLAQMKEFFTDSKVQAPAGAPDRVCTMEYRYPYARIVLSDATTYGLGEKSSSCDIVDLYSADGQRLPFQQFLQSLQIPAAAGEQ